MSDAGTDHPSLNKFIAELKKNCKALQQRADDAKLAQEAAEVDLAKAEAALRNLSISLGKERARADRAEAQLRSFGARIGVAA